MPGAKDCQCTTWCASGNTDSNVSSFQPMVLSVLPIAIARWWWLVKWNGWQEGGTGQRWQKEEGRVDQVPKGGIGIPSATNILTLFSGLILDLQHKIIVADLSRPQGMIVLYPDQSSSTAYYHRMQQLPFSHCCINGVDRMNKDCAVNSWLIYSFKLTGVQGASNK